MTTVAYDTENDLYVTIFDWYKGYIDAPVGPIGRIGFWGPPDLNGEVEMFYELVHKFRGKGLMSEIIAGLIYELDENHSNEVQVLKARVQYTNVASIKVLKKHGFIEEPLSSRTPNMRFYRRLLRDDKLFTDTRKVLWRSKHGMKV